MKGIKIILAVLATFLVVVLVIWDRDKIFTLDLVTEVAAFMVIDVVLSEWSFAELELIDDPFASEDQGRLFDQEVRLNLATQTRVRIQRHGTGQVRILLNREDRQSVGQLEDAEGDVTRLADWALLLLKPVDKPLVLPFRGPLIAGDDVTIGVDSILLSGTVSVVEAQLFGNAHYVAGVEKLDRGDRVQLLDNDDNESDIAATVSGFIRILPEQGFADSLGALALVAHGQADYVEVDRLGSAGYQIHASRWARFINDPLLVGMIATGGMMVLLFEIILKFLEISGNGQKRNQSSMTDKPNENDNA